MVILGEIPHSSGNCGSWSPAARWRGRIFDGSGSSPGFPHRFALLRANGGKRPERSSANLGGRGWPRWCRVVGASTPVLRLRPISATKACRNRSLLSMIPTERRKGSRPASQTFDKQMFVDDCRARKRALHPLRLQGPI